MHYREFEAKIANTQPGSAEEQAVYDALYDELLNKRLVRKAQKVLQAMPGYSSGPESPLYAQDVQHLVDLMKWARHLWSKLPR